MSLVPGLKPIELQDHTDAVWSIQQQLLRDDAFIIGLTNQDPRDYARTSVVTATSEQYVISLLFLFLFLFVFVSVFLFVSVF